MSIEPVIIGRATHIYGLCDEHGTVRYVGKTVGKIEGRLAQHKTASRKPRLPVTHWLRRHPSAYAILLETVHADGDWAARERHWISQHDNLLNLTQGGEGLAGHNFTAEHRAKISAALQTKEVASCHCCQAEFTRKPSEAKKGHGKFCSRGCYQGWQKGRAKAVPAHTTAAMINAAAAKRRAQTLCKRGHPLSGENLFRTSHGGRGCKTCRKVHKATYRSKANG